MGANLDPFIWKIENSEFDSGHLNLAIARSPWMVATKNRTPRILPEN